MDVQGILRSEMLDEKICPTCVRLDGIFLPVNDPRWNGELGQLAHQYCRAVWIPIYDIGTMNYTSDVNIPDVFMRDGMIKLIDDWDDLPMRPTGTQRITQLSIEEILELLQPYDLLSGYLGLR